MRGVRRAVAAAGAAPELLLRRLPAAGVPREAVVMAPEEVLPMEHSSYLAGSQEVCLCGRPLVLHRFEGTTEGVIPGMVWIHARCPPQKATGGRA